MRQPMVRFVFRYWFECAGGCLWPANEAACERFEFPVPLEELGLSDAVLERLRELERWYATALAPGDPNIAPVPLWRQEECDRFKRAADEALRALSAELGPEVLIVNEAQHWVEDPKLDLWLADPEEYRRRQQEE